MPKLPVNVITQYQGRASFDIVLAGFVETEHPQSRLDSPGQN